MAKRAFGHTKSEFFVPSGHTNKKVSATPLNKARPILSR